MKTLSRRFRTLREYLSIKPDGPAKARTKVDWWLMGCVITDQKDQPFRRMVPTSSVASASVL